MTVTAKKSVLSSKEYLDAEKSAEIKHEYLDGEIWDMVGASDAHVTIALNLAALLKTALQGTPCRTYISDMKVHVERANAFFYPDVLVTCEARDKANTYSKDYPILIAEVLSPSTEAFDRGAKFATYRQLDNLREYWLISTGKKAVDTFRRREDGDWILHAYTAADDKARIHSLELNIALNELYENVEFIPGQELSTSSNSDG